MWQSSEALKWLTDGRHANPHADIAGPGSLLVGYLLDDGGHLRLRLNVVIHRTSGDRSVDSATRSRQDLLAQLRRLRGTHHAHILKRMRYRTAHTGLTDIAEIRRHDPPPRAGLPATTSATAHLRSALVRAESSVERAGRERDGRGSSAIIGYAMLRHDAACSTGGTRPGTGAAELDAAS